MCPDNSMHDISMPNVDNVEKTHDGICAQLHFIICKKIRSKVWRLTLIQACRKFNGNKS